MMSDDITEKLDHPANSQPSKQSISEVCIESSAGRPHTARGAVKYNQLIESNYS